MTQAVFSLRGKPLNVHGMKLDQLYKNEEMFNLMSALNIEDDIANLRYNKVILATDADVDGMHIRNLLITFFLTYFEGLVFNGHLFILQTPLFKVRNKEKTIYCYSKKKKTMRQKNSKKASRSPGLKGLERSPRMNLSSLLQKISACMPVTIENLSDIKPTLEFYMGKNTPERKAFIMQNLMNEEWMISKTR